MSAPKQKDRKRTNYHKYTRRMTRLRGHLRARPKTPENKAEDHAQRNWSRAIVERKGHMPMTLEQASRAERRVDFAGVPPVSVTSLTTALYSGEVVTVDGIIYAVNGIYRTTKYGPGIVFTAVAVDGTGEMLLYLKDPDPALPGRRGFLAWT